MRGMQIIPGRSSNTTEIEKPKGLILMKMRQGREVVPDAAGHYEPLWLKGEYNLGTGNRALINQNSPRKR